MQNKQHDDMTAWVAELEATIVELHKEMFEYMSHRARERDVECETLLQQRDSTIAELRLALADARRRGIERAVEVVWEFGAQCAPGGVWVAEQIAEKLAEEAQKT